MAKRLLTSDQVKEYLNITDFRHITRDKLIEFVSAIPDMDRDVAIKSIEQFPEFAGYAKVLVEYYNEMCYSILSKNGDSVQAVMDGYMQTLNVLGKLIEADDLDSDDKRLFANKMVEIADKMAAFDSNNKRFLAEISKYTTWFAGCTLFVCIAVLGAKHKVLTVPQLT